MTVEGHITIERAIATHGPGPWWIAHEFPERPADRWTVWDWKCPACVLHLRAAAVLLPGHMGDTVTVTNRRVRYTLREIVTQVEEWLVEEELK